MRLYDLENGEQHKFPLAELHQNIKLFGFIAGYQTRSFGAQDPVNIMDAELLGKLHDAFENQRLWRSCAGSPARAHPRRLCSTPVRFISPLSQAGRAKRGGRSRVMGNRASQQTRVQLWSISTTR
ncbi:MAG: type IIL restriction-modification enzyme MmeI [Pseudomonadota bacterium]